MKFLNICILVTGMLCSMGPYAELVAVQEAIEAHNIKVKMYGSRDGNVQARSCEDCEYTNLKIDRGTAVTVDGKPVRMGKHLDKDWPGGLVIYDIKTGHIVRLDLLSLATVSRRGK